MPPALVEQDMSTGSASAQLVAGFYPCSLNLT